MKNLIRPFTLIAFALFIVGIFASLYFVFFVTPETILQRVGIINIDHTKLDLAKQATLNTLLLVAGELLLGLILIMVLLANNKQFIGTESIVYVTNYGNNKQDKSQTDSTQGESSTHQVLLDTICKEIQNGATDKDKLQIGLNQLCMQTQASIGALFMSKEIHSRRYIEYIAGYAYQLPESQTLLYEYGEGIAGQVAKDGRMINITKVPENYITVVSGLGSTTPKYMLVLPLKKEELVVGVLEIASFAPFTPNLIELAKEISEELVQYMKIEIKGVVLSKS